MADYVIRKQSDVVWAKASKVLATPADGTHTVCRIPKNTLVTNIIINKTVAYSAAGSVFAPLDVGTSSINQGAVKNSGGKYFTQAGAITVTTNDNAGTAGTFQVFVEYIQLKN